MSTIGIDTNLPIRSAIHAPPNEPIAPPIKNIDTIVDQSIFNSVDVNQLLYRSINVSLHQNRTC